MGLRIAIEGARELASGVWSASVPPDQLKFFGSPRCALGGPSVVLLPSDTSPADDAARLEVDPSRAHVLNLGQTTSTLILFGDAAFSQEGTPITAQTFGPAVQHDDAAFVEEARQLPQELAAAGTEILKAVRSEFPGCYLQRTESGRYVNRPTNFFAIKVQPRDRSYSIIVRGNPHEFRASAGHLLLKQDQRGYSRFKMTQASDLIAVLAVLRQAGRR